MPDPVVSIPLLGVAVTLGNLAIWLGLFSAVTCVALYWTAMLRTMRFQRSGASVEASAPRPGKRAAKEAAKDAAPIADPRTEAIARWARRFLYLTSVCVVLGSLALWSLILTQQYTVEYVHKNSNASLPFGFRFASF